MTSHVPPPRLWTPAGFAADGWQDEPVLPLADFLASASGHAVRLAAGEVLEPLLPRLDALALIVLEFPAYTDGRAYSKAEVLRRLGYAGRIRASGDVLIDQIAHMLRTGFDELEISHPLALARLESGSHPAFPGYCQPSARTLPQAGTWSWRRLPA
ncbi:MAG: DUF934 domain-containing protein [Rhizobiaceae bacterium]